jgi:uncharacterized protein (DUF2237 family)
VWLDATMTARNVLGGDLAACSFDPLTGYYRTGHCDCRGDDPGVHVVCARVTEEFLAFSVSRGNDLVTPMPQYGFAGLKPGDQWCLCASRWLEAYEAGVAPPVILSATHVMALEHVGLDALMQHAIDAPTT